MRLTMKERKSVAAIIAPRYQKAQKKQKGVILNEFIELTGYNRAYASYVLRMQGKKVEVCKGTFFEGDVRKRAKRKRQRTYDEKVLEGLKKIWGIMDYICGKRPEPILPEAIKKLQRVKRSSLIKRQGRNYFRSVQQPLTDSLPVKGRNR